MLLVLIVGRLRPPGRQKMWYFKERSIFASKQEKKLSLNVKFRSYVGMTETGRSTNERRWTFYWRNGGVVESAEWTAKGMERQK